MNKNWKRNANQVSATAIASPAVAKVVPSKGGSELRIYSTYVSAVAGGLHPEAANALFNEDADCVGTCWTQFSDDNLFVWCIDENCVSDHCECHLFETWTDAKGFHQADRGYPGEGWEYKRTLNRFYACRCTPKPI